MIDVTHSIANPARAQRSLAAGAAERALVYRRYRSLRQFDELSSEPDLKWLTAGERAELGWWRDRGRRQASLAGRMLAKELVANHAGATYRREEVEILSRDEKSRGKRPRIRCHGVEQPWSVSITHSEGGVLAALCVTEGVRVGVDLARTDGLSDAFVRLWFTPAEQAWLRETDCSSIAGFIWAAKEAVYKACNNGESFSPRDVEVLPHERCSYRQSPLADYSLRSWSIDGHIAVMVTVGTE
ncbi:MAG TPA: 4'-phosphopantetheinyl transferase superfamily protein [Pirellulales bacterium]|jgi:phosphopantetheinyl transferase|nr:4'-phosphopantetheinyl transferase superfamily protein [Pirellulales bacterium]